ncbi:MAG: helix-turn-helix domain-containing protein, partial [Muribaculaceae bacterium]|nr:helix-turn-helix domain-containing protein [Muribaculaceae bacterium]
MGYIEALQEQFNSIGLTQVEIADILGVTKMYVNALLTERKRFGRKQAEKWENLFGISKSWLLTGEGEMLKNIETTTKVEKLEESIKVNGRKERLIPFYDVET